LPAKWLKAMNLQAGSEINLSETNQNLIISTDSKKIPKEAELKISSEQEFMIRGRLTNIYGMGFDKIKVYFQNQKQEVAVKEVVRNFMMGFEVTEDKGNWLIVENVAEPSGEKQESLTRRIFLITLEAFSIILTDLRNNQFENKDLILERSRKVFEYFNFCRRNISTRRFTDEYVCIFWGFYDNIFRVQTVLNNLYQHLAEKKSVQLSSKSLQLFKQIEKSYQGIYEGFFEYNTEKLYLAAESLRELQETKLLEELSEAEEPIVIYYFLRIARDAALASSCAIELTNSES